MTQIIQTFRNLLKSGQGNLLKIICLAAGLSLGLVMIAKVCFINDYDKNIPDRERIVKLRECGKFLRDGGSDFVSGHTPGGVAPSVADEMPEVEAATRLCMLNGIEGEKVVVGENRLNAQIYCADTCFFDVFDLPILAGNPKEIFAVTGHTMVSRKMAEMMGGVEKALGQTFYIANDRSTLYTVDGVFENIPENCMLQFDALASIQRQGDWSLSNWMGNEQYHTFAKLREGVTREAAQPSLDKVVLAHIDKDELLEAGQEISYDMRTMVEMAENDTDMQNLKLLMLFLGSALIVIAVLNYLVFVVSSLVNRTKQIAVEKCYGALPEDILWMTFCEALVHLLLSLGLGIGLLYLIRPRAEELLDASFASIFSPSALLVISCVCAALLFVTTVVPAYIFNRVPVAAAFRSMKESKRVWKLTLLFLQFLSSSVIVGLLAVVALQYKKMTTPDLGYNYERLAVVTAYSIKDADRERIMSALEKLPEVELVTACHQLPHYGWNGNNVFLPGQEGNLFNIADLYCITEGYFDAFEIPVIDGKPFGRDAKNTNQMMVNRAFVEKMDTVAGWKGSIVGRSLIVSEHSQDNADLVTIVGVFEDIHLGNSKYNVVRPTVVFPVNDSSWARPDHIIIKLHSVTADTIRRINETVAAAYEERPLEAMPLKYLMLKRINDERNMRDSLTICSVVALIISLVGLLGYVADEVGRRRREMAIRRVLGATVGEVLQALARDITLIAIPALAIGSLGAAYLAGLWLENYTERITLSPWIFVASAASIYLLILACVVIRSWRAATENPILALHAN